MDPTNGVSLVAAAPTEAANVLETGLSPLGLHSAFWWRTTGYSLAYMLQQAGYTVHDQYTSLLFYRSIIIPAMGEQPDVGGRPSQWESYTTDDFSPIEYSWNWDGNGDKPKIRFAIEAIGPETGASVDLFNQRRSEDLISTLYGTSRHIDSQLFSHFWNTLLVSSKDSTLISERAPPYSHRSSLFVACELERNKVHVKAYFMPMLRSLETNQPRTQVVARAIRSLQKNHGEALYLALDDLIKFVQTDPMGSQTEIEMVSVDCLDLEEARIKVYIRHPQTSWESVRNMMTMNGQIKIAEDDLEELWHLWRAVLSLDRDFSRSAELPKCDHSTSGIFYCFYARAKDESPTPKLYMPVKHYGRNDRAIADGLVQYFGDRGKDRYIANYKDVIGQLSSHRPLESQCGIHTYISSRFTDRGLSVTSYLNPEIYHPARWTSRSSPHLADEYVFGRDYSASARLNYQHGLLKQHLGFLLHPSIAQTIGKARIADIGTGTGIWPLEASRTFPNAHFDGLDISPAQYPRDAWLPKNVALHVQDVYAQFPPQMLGTFDVVHIQKLITIVFNNDPVPLIQNVMKLLKPGGYIQWNEIDPASASIDPFALSAGRASATREMLDFMTSPEIARSMAWISKLDSILAAQGFETTIYDRAPIALEDRAAWNVGFLLTYEDAMTRAKRLDMKSLRLRLDKLHGELQQDVFLQPEIVLAVARKLEC